ncbi:CDF family Co(II)/Ni(II) efflux transporter DmeF [Tistrella mobilis]|uniref:Cation diffusion facilitator family transporter n=1 Tax=Tistrella mobilis (strain KA081020-065) TaxID=1110502 RepID=I3TMU5_TISMK|nr:CDF family Co(II)/Ni(II) efflux transporter DmeF [Tistrella mobilis]AFK54083.1 cation diffusion facilitator family transporter [Tistrella mobilis KA081020-065]
MHGHTFADHQHDHVFLGAYHDRNARRTHWVILLTAVMMVGEITAGMLFGSMALLADGWHMATHAGALAITAFAYAFARRYARDARFTFGTGKVGELAGFASAIALGVTALLIGWESVERLIDPVPIAFGEAITVAVLGLAVNLASAWLLAGGGHDHHHGHAHEHHHHHDHQDQNLRAAYLHVLADALTSVLAIVALVVGRYLGWVWMDPVVGVVGALVIGRWAYGLLRDTAAVLLDAGADPRLAERVRGAIERGGDRISDLHLWRVGPGRHAAIIALVTSEPRDPEHYRTRVSDWPELAHVTVEVHRCSAPH